MRCLPLWHNSCLQWCKEHLYLEDVFSVMYRQSVFVREISVLKHKCVLAVFYSIDEAYM